MFGAHRDHAWAPRARQGVLCRRINVLRCPTGRISTNACSLEGERAFVHKSSVSFCSATQLAAVSAPFVRERGDTFYRGVLRDAMTEIEDVAALADEVRTYSSKL